MKHGYRILHRLTALAAVCALLAGLYAAPGSAPAARAADGGCAGSHAGAVELGSWSALKSMATAVTSETYPYYKLPAGRYVLTADIQADAGVWFTGRTELCLNGHTLRGVRTDGYHNDTFLLVSGSGSVLEVSDCAGGGKLQGALYHGDYEADKLTDKNCYVMRVSPGCTFRFFGGSICDSIGRYGALYGNNAVVELYDGASVKDNYCSSVGGGVSLQFGGVLNMYGGEISGNSATVGGGVDMYGVSEFNMYGGVIRGNTARASAVGAATNGGGGVRVNNAQAVFNMYGGTVTGNTSRQRGGGVKLTAEGAVFNMYGGAITDNTAASYGGGLDAQADVSFRLYGGEISGNSVTSDNAEVQKSFNCNFYSPADLWGTVIPGGVRGTVRYPVAVNGSRVMGASPADPMHFTGSAAEVDMTTCTVRMRTGGDLCVKRCAEADNYVAAGQSMTLDLNGHSVTLADGEGRGRAELVNDGDFTLIDTSGQDGQAVMGGVAGGGAFRDPQGLLYVLTPEDGDRPGDLNGDGKVSAKDVVTLQRGLAGGWGAVPGPRADLTRDGKVNGKDAVLLQRVIAGGYGAVLPGPLPTRARLEQAVTEAAFAYYLKGTEYQYDNEGLDVMGRSHDGSTRVSHLASPEEITSDMTKYGVCTAYIFHVYYEALGHKLFGLDNENEFLTDRFWRIIENQADISYSADEPDPVTENDIDQCVLRWKSSDYTFDKTDRHFGVDRSPYFANFGDTRLTFANGSYAETADEQEAADNAVQAFINDWQHNLRPGDIFLLGGHAMLYVGNDCVLDCTARGGGKYDPDTGLEAMETFGSVYRMHTVEYYYTSGEYRDYWIDDAGTQKRVAIARPLDALVAPDGDDDPANDIVKDTSFTIPAKSVSRRKWPGIEIDRTADAGPYGTVPAGGTLTYRVKVTNRSDAEHYAAFRRAGANARQPQAYTGLPVTERIPDGTEFVSAGGGAVPEDGVLRWSLDIPAGGSAEVTYTVRAAAPMGTRITSSGGTVGGIPSNAITTAVGGAKPDGEKLAVLTAMADTQPALWPEQFRLGGGGLDFAARVYRAMDVELALPDIQQTVGGLFKYGMTARPSTDFAKEDGSGASVFTLRDAVAPEMQTLRAMLVDHYVGGYRYYAGRGNLDKDINWFSPSHLEPGDVIVCVAGASPYDESGVMVYAETSDGRPALLLSATAGGYDRLVGREAEIRLWQLLRRSVRLFFLLRPSQGVADLNAIPCTGPEPDFEPYAPPARPLKLGGGGLSEDALTRLAAMGGGDAVGARGKYALAVYTQMGLDGLGDLWVTDSGSKLTNALSLLGAMFLRTDDQKDDLNRTYLSRWPRNSVDLMAVDGFWGGPWVDGGGRTADGRSLGELQPGDVLFLYDRNLSAAGAVGSNELCAVYQGDGKFLVNYHCWSTIKSGPYGRVPAGDKYGVIDFTDRTPRGSFTVDGTETETGTTVRRVNDPDGADATHGYIRVLSFTDLLTVDPFNGNAWDFFLAVRPSQGVYDILDPEYIPAW